MKTLYIIICSILWSICVRAQEIKVLSFKQNPMDLSASTHPRYDINNDAGALVKVLFAEPNVKFEGDIIGTPEYKTNEYWVYMTAGSKMLQIRHSNFKSLLVYFNDYEVNGLKSKMTYVLDISYPKQIGQGETETISIRTSEESIKQMQKIKASIQKLGITHIGPFKNGIAPVLKDNKYAFIDKEGNQLTAFAFDSYHIDLYLKKEGWIVCKNGLYGVVNSKGKLTVDCVYKYIDKANGLASCSASIKVDEKNGAIDGKDISKAKYDIIEIETGQVQKKDIAYDIAHEMLYGETYPRLKGHNEFINKDGSKAFSSKYEYAYPFSENLACVKTKQDGWFILDQNGDKMGTLPKGAFPYYGNNGLYSDGRFHEGLLAIESGREVGYVDKYGNIVIPIQFSVGCNFSDGLAAVATGSFTNRRWMYIDKNGNVVIKPTEKLFSCEEFKNGIAIGTLCGYSLTKDPWPQVLYNKEGIVLLHGSTNSLNKLVLYGDDCFKYNLFPIERRRSNGEKYYAYVNKKYEVVSREFSSANIFMDEFTSVVSQDGHSGIIDRYGNIVWLNINNIL